MTKPYNIKKTKMIEALVDNLGVVTAACQKVGISRNTHYEWMRNDENYKLAVEDINNVVLDFAENKLYSLIEKGDTTAVIFLLKTRGKSRGYVERVNHDITSDGQAIKPILKFTNTDND